MPHILKNENLEISIDLPNEGYKATRFDYTGKITRVKFRGIPITTTEQLNAPTEDYLGKGFYNEFGIDSALGYDEIKADVWFHKIGVGLLRKDDEIYQLNKNYETNPADFQVKIAASNITIYCKSERINGYSYVLRKKIELHESSFTIHYCLENTGNKKIETTEYNHNFIAIDNELIGADYFLKFPFKIQPSLFEEVVNLFDCFHAGIVLALVGAFVPVLASGFLEPVVDATHKGRDQGDFGLGAGDGLRQAEQQGQVAVDTFFLKLACSFNTFPG